MKKIKIKDLIPDNKNNNKHTAYGMDLLEKSMRKVGIIESITISNDNKIISGNARHEKVGQLFDTEAIIIETDGTRPVILKRTDIESDTKQFYEASILANTTSKKNIDFDNDVIEELTMEFDLDIEELGVDIVEDDEVLEAGEDDFNGTPPKDPISVLGDLYEINNHRLLCGDSTCSDTVAKLMNGEKADMVFTDPPYGISYDSPDDKHDIILNDDKFLLEWMPQVLHHSKGFIFMWTSYQVVGKWIQLTKDYFGDITNMIIWHKGGGGLGDLYKRFSTDFEIALVWNRGETLKGKRIGSVWQISKDNTSTYQHPTQKPIELMTEGINNCSLIGNTIMDLFLGSGSTMVASHQLKRKCYGMELDPKYCDVIVARMVKLIREMGNSLTIRRNGQQLDDKEINKFIENTNG